MLLSRIGIRIQSKRGGRPDATQFPNVDQGYITLSSDTKKCRIYKYSLIKKCYVTKLKKLFFLEKKKLKKNLPPCFGSFSRGTLFFPSETSFLRFCRFAQKPPYEKGCPPQWAHWCPPLEAPLVSKFVAVTTNAAITRFLVVAAFLFVR